MKRILATGLTGFATGLALTTACADEAGEKTFERDGGIELVVEDQVNVLEQPNAVGDPEAVQSTLKIGEKVIAICYFESGAFASDSVKIETDDAEGFTFLRRLEDDTLIYAYGKDDTQNLHKQLPDCTADETDGALGGP